MAYQQGGQWFDDLGNPLKGDQYPEDTQEPGGTVRTVNPTASTPDWDAVSKQLQQAGGSLYDPSDLAGVQRHVGYDVGGSSLQDAIKNQLGIYDQRRGPTSSRTADSQSAAGNAAYGSGTGNSSNTPGSPFQSASAPPSAPTATPNTSPMFDDPASRLIEDYALQQFQNRQNPDPNSGTAQYEQLARNLIQTLQQPVYSAGDESIIKGRAFDALAKEQDATQQQWLEELSRRGIPPSSGPALQGFLQIKDHFETLRTQVESQFAQSAIDQTRQQRVDALNTAGQLANSEEGRLREALTYASLPKQLEDNSFQQGLQLVGAGGTPSSVLQSARQINQAGQTQSAIDTQNRQQLAQGVMALLQQYGLI